MKINQITGLFVVIFGILTYFVFIPYGIKIPKNIDQLTLSPAFWPTIITAIITFMGILLIIPERDKAVVNDEEEEEEEEEARTPWGTRLPRLAILFVLLFGFYYLIEQLGMVVPSIVTIFFLMVFAGYRRWWLMLFLSLSVPIILYLFFVYVANIPIPLGIFESIRG